MKLLLLSASAGAGHVRAAAAIEAAARRRWPDATITNVDILTFATTTYRKTYANAWLGLAERSPALWGYLYASSDTKRTRAKPPAVIRAFDKLMFAKFRRFVRETAPDHVIATHFLPAQILAAYRKQAWCRFGFGCVLTDFDCHALWAQPAFERFCVGTEELVDVLVEKGVARDRVTVTGIPIGAAFAKAPSRAAARKRLGLDDTRPVVLCMGGGMGIGNMGTYVTAVTECPPVQVLAVTGKNAKLQRELERLAVPKGTTLQVHGYVDTIPEFMAAADLMVGKSGGLTTSECLASGLPMLVPDPIPGQEEHNADHLVEIGAGLKARGLGSFRFKLKQLLANAEQRTRMAERARAHGKPGAADAVLRALIT